jgi:hypothetical protein
MSGPLGDFSFVVSRGQTLFVAAGRLETLKALLPEDEVLESKYVAELHAIIEMMERGGVLNVSRFRMASRDRFALRINILALLGVCEYQSRPPMLAEWQALPRTEAPRRYARNVH